MDTLTVLIKAKKLVEINWVDHIPRNADEHCMLTAMIEAGDSAFKACRAFIPIIGTSAPGSFNDTPGRTLAEVLDVFDKAIANERAKFEAQFLDPQQTLSDCTEPSSTRAAAELVP